MNAYHEFHLTLFLVLLNEFDSFTPFFLQTPLLQPWVHNLVITKVKPLHTQNQGEERSCLIAYNVSLVSKSTRRTEVQKVIVAYVQCAEQRRGLLIREAHFFVKKP